MRAGPAVPRSVQELSFGLDVDSVDRSLASVAAKFFPLGARVVRIRKFIELKRRRVQGEGMACMTRSLGCRG